MASDHDHAALRNRAFAVGLGLNAAFVIVELAYGYLGGSLALIADAGHNFSDVLTLLLAWGALLIAERMPSPRFTYGLRKATILAALVSSVLLLVALGAIAWEAVQRFRTPAPVDGSLMLAVAAAGVVVNTATAALFFAQRKRDLNLQAAFLHMAADAGVSLGVLVAGGAIMLTGWIWLDPALSLAIAAVILASTSGLLRDSVRLSLDAAPGHIDLGAVDAWLRGQPGVTGIHDLHVWALSTTQTALTVHLVAPSGAGDEALARIATGLERDFDIGHCTLQIEHSESDCAVSCAPRC